MKTVAECEVYARLTDRYFLRKYFAEEKSSPIFAPTFSGRCDLHLRWRIPAKAREAGMAIAAY